MGSDTHQQSSFTSSFQSVEPLALDSLPTPIWQQRTWALSQHPPRQVLLHTLMGSDITKWTLTHSQQILRCLQVCVHNLSWCVKLHKSCCPQPVRSGDLIIMVMKGERTGRRRIRETESWKKHGKMQGRKKKRHVLEEKCTLWRQEDWENEELMRMVKWVKQQRDRRKWDLRVSMQYFRTSAQNSAA